MNRDELNKKFHVTDEQLDQWAEEYENETWDVSGLGEVMRGRPRLSAQEDAKQVTFRLPASKIVELDVAAAAHGCTRSEALRDAVDDYLAQA